MKIFNRYIILMVLTGALFACEDQDLKDRNFPGWETGVNGFGAFQDGSAVNFTRGDVSKILDFSFQWVSSDGANSVSKIEFFINFEEKYINKDGDPATVDHGTEIIMSVDSPPANREDITFSIAQADLYALFQSLSFDYDEDGTATPVFSNPVKPGRTALTPFVDGDSFALSWSLTTDDGRVFDSWSPSACTELPGSNCQLGWIVICAEAIADPPGDYTINMNDSYGDGWNDAAIRVIVDGTPTDYTLDDGGSGVTVVTVPAGTSTLTFEFVSGDWDSEVTFTVVSPKGNVIASGGPSPSEGNLTLDLCAE